MSNRYWMPTRIDDPPKFMLWDMDACLIVMLTLGIGGMFDGFIIAVLVAPFAYIFFMRAKTGKHPYYLSHIVAWYFPGLLKNRRSSSSIERAFLG